MVDPIQNNNAKNWETVCNTKQCHLKYLIWKKVKCSCDFCVCLKSITLCDCWYFFSLHNISGVSGLLCSVMQIDISNFVNMSNMAHQGNGFSFFQDISITNVKGWHLYFYKTNNQQIWKAVHLEKLIILY